MREPENGSHDMRYDVIIVGGGIAGLTAATQLADDGKKVLVIEKHPYPRHKVCGEYVSNEVLPFLKSYGIDPAAHGAKNIERMELSTADGNVISTQLPLGGFSISRYAFDALLAKTAQEKGSDILHAAVTSIDFDDESFSVHTGDGAVYEADFVIGAYGKRSGIDGQLGRKHAHERWPYMAVKMHVEGEFPEDLVALHNFEGGYCGVSKVENDHINLCYITHTEAFKKEGTIERFQRNVIRKNRHLDQLFDLTKPVFEQPLTISQISFAKKSAVEHHVFMCGDTAGLIHPLCGNGMSMAIRGAQLVVDLLRQYWRSDIKSRSALETTYQQAWNKEFRNRLQAGSMIAALFSYDYAATWLLRALKWAPGLLPNIIRQTHGKPMTSHIS